MYTDREEENIFLIKFAVTLSIYGGLVECEKLRINPISSSARYVTFMLLKLQT